VHPLFRQPAKIEARSDPEGEARWHANKDIIQWLEDL
jgi:hypothetical protein